ncbi:hypothetical protein K435DRAFT_813154 [Dendrothele bispora CBS 962.96]|uniref:DUF6532 domain-containing protein n=1 Tax=Dendrothele bispora (strain CBS 962.96) TaxID=1314807 RepID=A0A4S8KMI1_DENBC|nr:hypothetical protein K435DRAFT_813154 [Dendrothele bispora CBS 962.96]
MNGNKSTNPGLQKPASTKSVPTSPALQDSLQQNAAAQDRNNLNQFPPPPWEQGQYSFGIMIPYDKYWTYAEDNDPLPPADQEHLREHMQKLSKRDRQAQRNLPVDLCETQREGSYFPIRVLAFCSNRAKSENRQVTEEVLKKVESAKIKLGDSLADEEEEEEKTGPAKALRSKGPSSPKRQVSSQKAPGSAKQRKNSKTVPSPTRKSSRLASTSKDGVVHSDPQTRHADDYRATLEAQVDDNNDSPPRSSKSHKSASLVQRNKKPVVVDLVDDDTEDEISNSLPVNAQVDGKISKGKAKVLVSERGHLQGPAQSTSRKPNEAEEKRKRHRDLEPQTSGEEYPGLDDVVSSEPENAAESHEAGNQMVVESDEDADPPLNLGQRAKKGKIRLGEFGSDEEQDIAQLARRVARMHICFQNMYAKRSIELWPSLVSYLSEKGNVAVNKAFECLMSYGVVDVRGFMLTNSRGAITTYFGLPGRLSQEKIRNRVAFLVRSRCFHHGDIDMEKETFNSDAPFKCPVIALVLRETFVVPNCEPNELLVNVLHKKKAIPLGLIAMAATIVNHALTEMASGAQVDISLKTDNTLPHYRAIKETLARIEKNSPKYFKKLCERLYQDMVHATADPITVDDYDYGRLEEIAGMSEGSADEEEEG